MGAEVPVNAAIIIPWRDRGRDPLRRANLDRVLEHWVDIGLETLVVDDGRQGDEQFNRSIAYNKGAAQTSADVLAFLESDLLFSHNQLREAIDLAAASPGLVIPFYQYRALSPTDSVLVRAHEKNPADCVPEFRMDGDAIGAANVLSRDTLSAVGRYDPNFQGSWFDDKAMCCAFEICAGPRRHVEGASFHLFHLPGWKGDHLTPQDRAATDANAARWERYLQATTPEEIRALTMEGS